MTNYIEVRYSDLGVEALKPYIAFLNERPMKIDDDSQPIDRKKIGDYKMRALDAIVKRTEGMPSAPHNERTEGTRTVFTASRDIKAEGVTRAQNEMVKFIAEAMRTTGVAAMIADPAERYVFAVDLIKGVLDDLGLGNA